MIICNCYYEIIKSFGILALFVYLADIHYWSIQESDPPHNTPPKSPHKL